MLGHLICREQYGIPRRNRLLSMGITVRPTTTSSGTSAGRYALPAGWGAVLTHSDIHKEDTSLNNAPILGSTDGGFTSAVASIETTEGGQLWVVGASKREE